MGLLARLDDRLPPELVREVRRDLRTRLFAATFLGALALALATTALWALTSGGQTVDGRGLLAGLHVALAAVAYVALPFGAWLSMDEEHGGGRLDLLLMTRLSPARVALGKVAATLVRVVLVLLAFAPFLCVATLGYGVEPGVVRGVALEVLARATAVTALALALASQATGRGLRGATGLALGLAGSLAVLWQGGLLVIAMNVGLEEVVPHPALVNQLAAAALDLAVAAVLFSAVHARLEHARLGSSRLSRGLVSAAVAALVLRGWIYEPSAATESLWFGVHLLVGVLLVLVPSTFFVTEPERLRAFQRRWIPRARWRAALAAPWIPGRDRGVLFLTVHLALFGAGAVLTPFARGLLGAGRLRAGLDGGPAAVAAFTALFGYAACVVPSGILLEFSASSRARRRLRVALPLASVGIGALAALAIWKDDDVFWPLFLIVGLPLLVPAVPMGLAQSVSGVSSTLQSARIARLLARRRARVRAGTEPGSAQHTPWFRTGDPTRRRSASGDSCRPTAGSTSPSSSAPGS